jgi:hypothetical protein
MRHLAAFTTGLSFSTPSPNESTSTPSPFGSALTKTSSHAAASTLAATTSPRSRSSGVRFTFILYENQRRWIGLGWTTSLFAYERGPWTDEHLNPAPAKDEFELPEVESGTAKWRWVDSAEWRIDKGDGKKGHSRGGSKSSQSGAKPDGVEGDADGGGWIYYDNRWEDGKKEDGWGRYTRRRKWVRDAELVEVEPEEMEKEKDTGLEQGNGKEEPKSDDEQEKIRKARQFASGLSVPSTPTAASAQSEGKMHTQPISIPQKNGTHTTSADLDPSTASAKSPSSKKSSGWFRRGRSDSKSSSSKNTGFTQTSTRSRDDPEDDYRDKWRDQDSRHRGFSVQEDVQMSLG